MLRLAIIIAAAIMAATSAHASPATSILAQPQVTAAGDSAVIDAAATKQAKKKKPKAPKR